MDKVRVVDLHKIMYSDSGSEEDDSEEEEADSENEGECFEPEVKIEIKEEDEHPEHLVEIQTEAKEESAADVVIPEETYISTNPAPPRETNDLARGKSWKKWYPEYDKLFTFRCTTHVNEDGSPKVFATCQEMRTHFRAYHNKQSGYGFCSLCANRRLRYIHFHGHFQHHLNPDWSYPCLVCLKQFESRSKLREHMRHHRAVTIETRKKYHQINKTTCCKVCNISFESTTDYKHHIATSLQHNPMVVCDVCGKSFRKSYYNSEHQFSHKAEELPCPDCGKIFPTRVAVYQHRRNIHSGNIYECKFCDYKTRHGTVMPKHVRSKHGINPDGSPYVAILIDCPKCDKKFADKKGLRAHIPTHTGSRNHICEYCSATFKTASSYYSHRKSKHPVEWQMSRA